MNGDILTLICIDEYFAFFPIEHAGKSILLQVALINPNGSRSTDGQFCSGPGGG
jgi:hypothetical protein